MWIITTHGLKYLARSSSPNDFSRRTVSVTEIPIGDLGYREGRLTSYEPVRNA